MNWKVKAGLQRVIGMLPSRLGYPLYYCVQRHFGGLRKTDPMARLRAGVGIMDRIHRNTSRIESKTFLEIGTGQSVSLPIALWLGGASRIITVDLNPYLKLGLVAEEISFIKEHQEHVKEIFGVFSHYPIFQERLRQLFVQAGDLEPARVLNVLNIEYMAPADARQLALESDSVDYHVSYTVLEHIPPETLRGIFLEGQRILKTNGLFIHCIDMSDHFSHSDHSISAINFLLYDETEWSRYAGNRYMYQNRLRVDDLLRLIEKADLEVVSLETKIDQKALQELNDGFQPHKRFETKSNEVNATTTAWIVAKHRSASSVLPRTNAG